MEILKLRFTRTERSGQTYELPECWTWQDAVQHCEALGAELGYAYEDARGMWHPFDWERKS